MICAEDIQVVVSREAVKSPIKRVWLFGSYARDDARSESDVDIAIEPDSGLPLMGMSSFKSQLEKSLGVPVDLVTCDGMFSHVRSGFDRDVMVLHERM